MCLNHGRAISVQYVVFGIVYIRTSSHAVAASRLATCRRKLMVTLHISTSHHVVLPYAQINCCDWARETNF